MYPERRALLDDLQRARGSSAILYVTGDRRGLETQIGADALSCFIRHLDAIGDVARISLVLYTSGGDTLSAWTLINLVRQFCKELEIIVPEKARSAGTLMCLSANRIIMTKQATLGPIDPSVSTPLNPVIPGSQARVPVSVESINAYIDFARSAMGGEADLTPAFQQLANHVHPLVLGNAYRARTQIRMLAERLLRPHGGAIDVVKILDFLCSQSGSHDYTINRREAKDELGLPIEKPDDELYTTINGLYRDFARELELLVPFDPGIFIGANSSIAYSFPRALVESVAGGSHALVSEGSFTKQRIPHPAGLVQEAVSDSRSFEGWRHHAP